MLLQDVVGLYRTIMYGARRAVKGPSWLGLSSDTGKAMPAATFALAFPAFLGYDTGTALCVSPCLPGGAHGVTMSGAGWPDPGKVPPW